LCDPIYSSIGFNDKVFTESAPTSPLFNRGSVPAAREGTNLKTLIVYGTRYGATASTSEEIAKKLGEEGFDVKVVNAKKEKVADISEYELVIVGSGMQAARWCGEAENFLKKFQNELRQIKTAIFVSSGVQAILKHEGETDAMDKAWKKNLVEKAEKYSLNPVALGLFGGVWDYNKMGFFAKKAVGPLKAKLLEIGFEPITPGVYDTRDWEEIHIWAKELAQKVNLV
jgi:menaquinone-dependent protoporphyrinogen oxidase